MPKTIVRKAAAIAGALALGYGLLAGTATSASAAQTRPDHSCDAGDFCVFTDYLFGGTNGQVWAWQGDDLDWCFNDGTPPCNRDHSWANEGIADPNGYNDVVIYDQGAHDTGSPGHALLCIPRHHFGVGTEVPSADGHGSAHRWVNTGCPGGVPVLPRSL
jgi:hypothetical protein